MSSEDEANPWWRCLQETLEGFKEDLDALSSLDLEHAQDKTAVQFSKELQETVLALCKKNEGIIKLLSQKTLPLTFFDDIEAKFDERDAALDEVEAFLDAKYGAPESAPESAPANAASRLMLRTPPSLSPEHEKSLPATPTLADFDIRDDFLKRPTQSTLRGRRRVVKTQPVLVTPARAPAAAAYAAHTPAQATPSFATPGGAPAVDSMDDIKMPMSDMRAPAPVTPAKPPRTPGMSDGSLPATPTMADFGLSEEIEKLNLGK